MQWKPPKNDSRFEWTHHVLEKMRYYGLSEGRVRRVIHAPKRLEEGIAPGTIAVMQASSGAKNRYEVWVMYQEIKSKSQNSNIKLGKRKELPMLNQRKKRIITAWRYPGVSKPRGPVPIPEDVMAELGIEFQ